MTRLRTIATHTALRLAPTAVQVTLIAFIAGGLVVTAPVAVAVLGLAFSLDRSEP